MKYAKKAAILAVALIFGEAIAQKPAVNTDRAKLNFLVGSFATETKMPPSRMAPNGATGKGTSVITWALDSMFLLIDEQSVNPVFGQYKGHGMLGLDAQTHQFVLSMFNNFGDHPSYKGNFVGDTLVLETQVPMQGRPFDQKLVWYKDGGAVKLKVLNDFGKGFVPALEETSIPVEQKMR